MKQVMMIKFDSPKWRMIDEYKVANPFIEVGFRQVKDVVDLRVFLVSGMEKETPAFKWSDRKGNPHN